MAASITKLCTGCGLDVSDKPRTKDAQGRYFCQACGAKAAAAKPPATPPAKPMPAAAPMPAAKPMPAADAPMLVDPIMEKVLSQALPPLPAGKDGARAVSTTCNACSAAMSPGATICLVCGYNAATGKVMKTKVLAAEKSGGGGKGGPKISLGSNTDWSAVGKLAGGIFLYFVVLGFLVAVNPLFIIPLALSLMVYGLYYMIAMIVQPFLEGRVLWGMFHIAVMVLTVSAFSYAKTQNEDNATIVPLLVQLPSIYYVFWLCENNRLKAMWLLTLIFWAAIFVLALVFGIAAAAAGGSTP